jgi:hypothetical protein
VRTHTSVFAPFRAAIGATLALAALVSLTIPVLAADAPKKTEAGMIEGNPSEIPQATAAAPRAAGPASLERSTQGLVRVRHADGSSSVHLQGRFRNYSVVTFDADGTRRFHCVETAAAALALCERAAVSESPRFGGPRCAVGPREE